MQREQEQRRWKRELDLAKKREDTWLRDAEKLYARYRGGERKRNSFNMLWANTEILRPSVYNSPPVPDVRRRFRDADPVGKAVSEVLERALQVAIDAEGFESGTRYDVLDSLIVGRGLSRVRYVPSFSQVGVAPDAYGAHDEQEEEPSHEAHEGVQEELDYEQVVFEHVDWKDFRHGYGRVWAEVPWIAFRCKLSRAEVVERFGEDIAVQVEFDQVRDQEASQRDDESSAEKVAEFWEIWDKERRKVCFLQECCEQMIYPLANPTGEPPLALRDFFCIPEPLRMVEDSSSLLPIPLFRLYAEQADEVDRLSLRINKIVGALKVRGVYDATLSELGDLMNGEDNDLVPVSKAAAWKDAGGFERAIWWMPIQQAAVVLRELYTARDQAKQTIYEITGISDIVRGASQASETATAQQIKSQFASVRLTRMRQEVSRYVRDLVRLAAEVIAEKFQPETLAAMTGLQFPTAEQKMLAQGDPAVASLPTIEDVLGVLRSDGMRQFRVDIETSSTVAASIESDMSGLREVLGGLVEFWNGSAGAVQAGALPIDAVKAISLEVVRRSRMGVSVEDAIDQIRAPQAPANAGAEQAQAQAADLQRQVAELERAARDFERQRLEAETARKLLAADQRAAAAEMQAQSAAAAPQGPPVDMTQMERDRLQIEALVLDNEKRRRELAAQEAQLAQLQAELASAQSQSTASADMQAVVSGLGQSVAAIGQAVGEMSSAVGQLNQANQANAERALAVLGRPKRLVREGGRIARIEVE